MLTLFQVFWFQLSEVRNKTRKTSKTFFDHESNEFADYGINENHGAPTEIETPWLLVEHLELIALRFQIPETCGESVMEFVY